MKSMTMATAATALLAVTAFGAAPAAADGEIRLLTWEGYDDPSFVDPFTEATGCRVTTKYIGSGDEIMTALLAGRGDEYDLTTPSADLIGRLIDAGKIAPVDMSRVGHTDEFFGAFQNPPHLMRDGKTYGVPYTWGLIRIIVDADKVPDPENSLSVLWREELRGQVSVWDDLEAIYMTGRYLGFDDVYNMTDEQLEQVHDALIEMKPNIRKYWASAGELDTLYLQNELAASNSWESTLVEMAKHDDRNVVEVVPKEGNGGWSDSWVIVDGAGDNDCVYEWLDYNSSAEAQAAAFKVTGFGYANTRISEFLDDETKATLAQLRMTDPEALAGVDWWQSVADRGAYLEVWNRVKAAAQ